jgi:hypothetical protein
LCTFIVKARIKGKQKALIVRRLLRGLPVGRQGHRNAQGCDETLSLARIRGEFGTISKVRSKGDVALKSSGN